MKTGILTVLYIALMAGCLSVCAKDNPDQAAARAALEQKLRELSHPGGQPLPDTNSVATVAVQPAESTTNTAHAAPALAASATEVPAATTPAKAASAAPAPADSDFAAKVPADNTAAQAAALVALKQKMNEMNQSKTQPPSHTNSTATMATISMAVPANEPSASATPVIETPAAEVPLAKTPKMAPAAVTPVSAAPAVVTPTPKVATTPAAATTTVAVVPPAVSGPASAPAKAQPAAALPFPFSSPGLARPTNELVTNSGKTYRNVEVERVVSDGIYISYIPAHGGWAMTKVPFKELPPEIRRQYENK